MTLRAELRVERERFGLDIALTVEPGEVVALLVQWRGQVHRVAGAGRTAAAHRRADFRERSGVG